MGRVTGFELYKKGKGIREHRENTDISVNVKKQEKVILNKYVDIFENQLI